MCNGLGLQHACMLHLAAAQQHLSPNLAYILPSTPLTSNLSSPRRLLYKARQDLCCCCFSCKAKDWAERARCSTKRRREQQYLQATNNKQINMLTIRHAMTHPTLKAKDLGPWPACKHNRCVDSMKHV